MDFAAEKIDVQKIHCLESFQNVDSTMLSSLFCRAGKKIQSNSTPCSTAAQPRFHGAALTYSQCSLKAPPICTCTHTSHQERTSAVQKMRLCWTFGCTTCWKDS